MKKKEFVLRHIKNPTDICWPKEMKIVKSLFKIFPNMDFWNSLNLGFKLNSLCWLMSDSGRDFLNKQYKHFCFELNSPKQYDIPQNILDSTNKTVEIHNNKNTLKNFLKLW